MEDASSAPSSWMSEDNLERQRRKRRKLESVQNVQTLPSACFINMYSEYPNTQKVQKNAIY